MQIILLERVPKLGQMGDVVKVKPGFARNFLLPQKKALRATKDNITYFESQRKTLEAQNADLLERLAEVERRSRMLVHAKLDNPADPYSNWLLENTFSLADWHGLDAVLAALTWRVLRLLRF